MSRIIIVKRGQLDKNAKERLRRRGHTWVEVDDLSNIKVVDGPEVIPSNQLMAAAAQAIEDDAGLVVKARFGQLVAHVILIQEGWDE